MQIPFINPKVHLKFTDVCVNMITVEFDDLKIPQFGRNKVEQLIIILLVHEPYRNITFPVKEVVSNSSSFALHDYCLSKA